MALSIKIPMKQPGFNGKVRDLPGFSDHGLNGRFIPWLVKTPPGSPSPPKLGGVGLESLVWLADSMGSLEEHLVAFFAKGGVGGMGVGEVCGEV